MKILIPNATGPNNIGDEAILYGLIKVLKEKYKNPSITVHTYDPQIALWHDVCSINRHIYSYMIFEKPHWISRSTRMIEVFYVYISKILKLPLIKTFCSPQLRSIMEDYESSDIIVFVGGGIYRTRKGFTQHFNLLMQLFIISFSKIWNKKIFIMPMSFGPFAHAWHEKITSFVLHNVSAIFAREKISYNWLKETKVKSPVYLSTDLALFLNNPFPKKHTSNIIGFTIRNWLPNIQVDFEKEFISGLKSFAEKNDVVFQPISQVHAKEYGEDDSIPAERVSSSLKEAGYKVMPLKTITSLEEALFEYSNLDFLIGMRMHSNILAAISGIPFISVGYEYKSEGISETLGFSNYNINVSEVIKTNKFGEIINEAWSRKTELTDILLKNLSNIQQCEEEIQKILI